MENDLGNGIVPTNPDHIDFRKKVADQITPEQEPVQNLSFSEAQDFLSENGSDINLEKIISQSNKERKRWGLGEVDLEEVRAEVILPKADLQKLIDNPALGSEAHLSVMDTEKTYGENHHEHFKQLQGIIGDDCTDIKKSLNYFGKVDSNHRVLPNDKQKPSKKYKIIFTPKERNLENISFMEEQELLNVNANELRKKMTEGIKFITLDVWINMFQRGVDQLLVEYNNDIEDLKTLYQLDEKLYAEKCNECIKNADKKLLNTYLSDTNIKIQFPDLEDLQHCLIPLFKFDINERKLCLSWGEDILCININGSARPALG